MCLFNFQDITKYPFYHVQFAKHIKLQGSIVMDNGMLRCAFVRYKLIFWRRKDVYDLQLFLQDNLDNW